MRPSEHRASSSTGERVEHDHHRWLLLTILFVTFTIGPSVMKIAILPALGLLLPYALRL